MNLELELQRMIKASREALDAYQKMKDTYYDATPKEKHRIKMYDLKKATERAESELKKKQTELFTNG